MEEYLKYVFDLASLAFKVRVIVCFIQPNQPFLSETIYANKFTQEIRIFDNGNATFEALQRKYGPRVNINHGLDHLESVCEKIKIGLCHAISRRYT